MGNLTFKLPALRIIENEHHLLRYLMEKWHPIVLEFEHNAYTLEQGHIALSQLRTQILDFLQPLQKHIEKEEAFLIPLLSQYVGSEQGPVLAIEDEHEEISAYIDHFLHRSQKNIKTMTMQQMRDVVRDAGEVFEVITFHLIKEESIIFPMVEDILSPKEQYTLFENLYSSII